MYKRLVLLITPLLLAPSVAFADNLIKSLAACKTISNDQQRLACFDAIESPALERLASKETKPKKPQRETDSSVAVRDNGIPAGKPSIPAAAERGERQREIAQSRADKAKASADADFGLPPKAVEEELDEITATIKALSETARGKLIIELDNGSRWQQKDAQYMSLTTGMKVTIERGFLGAYFLSHDGVNSRIKVKRVD